MKIDSVYPFFLIAKSVSFHSLSTKAANKPCSNDIFLSTLFILFHLMPVFMVSTQIVFAITLIIRGIFTF